MFITILWQLAAAYVIGQLLFVFPKDVAPDDSDPFGQPQSKPAYPVPIVFGTRRIRGVNTLWYGKISYTKITQKVKSLFKKKKVTIGYKYYIGMQLGLCYGFTGLVFKTLYVGEDLVYPQPVTTASSDIEFLDSNPDTIKAWKYTFSFLSYDFTQESDSAFTEFTAGYNVKVRGSVNNDGEYLLSGVTSSTLTLDGAESLVAEYNSGAVITITQEAVLPNILSGNANSFSHLNLYGGQKQSGGVSGTIRFYNGVDALAVAPTLQNDLGSIHPQLPHYRDLAQFTVSNGAENGGMYVGTSKQVRSLSAVIANTDFLGGGVEPYSDGFDVNPITVLRQILIADDRFSKLTTAEVDIPSLTNVEQQVFDEGLLFSPIFSRTKSIDKMIEVILKFVDAVFFTNPLTGLLTLKLLRQLVPTGNEITLDSTNVVKIIKTHTPDKSSTINEIKLTYTDRNHNYESRTITSQDLAAFITSNQQHNTRSVDFPSICTIAVARQICDRQLMQLSKAVTTLDIETNRILSSTTVGEQVIVNLPEVGANGEYYRVATIDYGTLEQGSIRATLISDVYTDNISVYSKEDGSKFNDQLGLDITTEITNDLYLEMPRQLLKYLSETDSDEDSEWNALAVVPPSDSNNLLFDIHTDHDQDGAFDFSISEAGFTPEATLTSDFGREEIGSNFLDNSHALQFTVPSQDLESLIVTDAQNLNEPLRYAYMEDEWLLYTSLENLGGGVYSLNDVRRGAMDTPPTDHVIGDRIYFVSDSEEVISETGFSNAITTAVDVKLDPLGLQGYFGIDNVTHEVTVTPVFRAKKPVCINYLKFNNSFITSVGSPITTTTVISDWRYLDRTIYDKTWRQGTENTRETNVTVTANVYLSDGTTLLRSVTGITAKNFYYTKADEFTDHGQNDAILVFEFITVDSVVGNALYARKETVYLGAAWVA